MHLSVYLLLLVTTFFIQSCQFNTNKQSKSEEDLVVIEEQSRFIQQYFSDVFLPDLPDIFRSVNFDEEIEIVKEKEAKSTLQLADESDGYLQYEKDLFTDTIKGIDYIMIKYIFDSHDRLWVITANYIIQDSSKTAELYDHLNTTFNEKYGDYYFDRDGFTVWEGAYKRDDSTEVIYDLGVRKLLKFDDPGIQIEMMRFGKL